MEKAAALQYEAGAAAYSSICTSVFLSTLSHFIWENKEFIRI
jgi:hypothetical protein